MELYFNYEHDEQAMAAFPLRELAEFVLSAEEVPENSRASITFVDNDEIHRLNREFRGIDKPTDVLSFEGEDDDGEWPELGLPIGVPDFAAPDGLDGASCADGLTCADEADDCGADDGVDFADRSASRQLPHEGKEPPFELGDVIIAPDVARAQCGDFNMTLEGEVSLLLTHGLLHLCGYDHIEDDDAAEMQAREVELLKEWAKTHPDVAPPDYEINAEMVTGEH